MFDDEFYNAIICSDGHVAIDYDDSGFTDSHCEKCGKPLISKCEKCGTLIRGSHNMVIGGYVRPNNCRKCGTPYPWASKMLDKLNAMLLIDSMLDDSEKAVIREYAPNLLINDDNMLTSAVLIKGITLKATNITKQFIFEMVKSIGIESIIKIFR